MTTMINKTQERTRFMRFALVGVVGAIVDFGTFNLLNGFLGVLPLIAQTISFLAAVVNNFIWNRYWTYPDSRSKDIRKQLIQFFLVSMMGLAIRTPIFVLMERPFTTFFGWLEIELPFIPGSTDQFLGHNAALAAAVLVVMIWNFFINRYWTYNDVK